MVTLQDAQKHLQAWLQADLAVATGQSYRLGSRELTRVDVKHIKERINYWTSEVYRLKKGRRRGAKLIRAMPVDL